MTCRECELALASEERISETGLHVATCEACREIAIELRANSEALAAMSEEPMPAVLMRPAVVPVSMRAMSNPRFGGWQWAAAGMAIAAMVVLALLGSRARLPRTPEIPNVAEAPRIAAVAAPAEQISQVYRAKTPRRRVAAVPKEMPVTKKSEPKILQVKMLTDDPNVVIYWQIEN